VNLADLVMLAPKDHWPLVKELKRLTLQETIRLLRYCQVCVCVVVVVVLVAVAVAVV
jgi:hypothetical protein